MLKYCIYNICTGLDSTVCLLHRQAVCMTFSANHNLLEVRACFLLSRSPLPRAFTADAPRMTESVITQRGKKRGMDTLFSDHRQ